MLETTIMRTLLASLLCTLPMVGGSISFNRDIRPIMADTCFRCHGPDKSSRMANLRLDLREEAIKPTRRGDVPIVPGDPSKSLIIQRIFAEKPALLMPPASSHKTLSAEQKQKVRQWIEEGAVYEGHWAYQPVRRPEVPAGAASHPVDAFIRVALTTAALKPSPAAEPRTLLRRLYLDLTGLPPSPEEVEEFLRDKNYEKVVDRLLASDRYAERQAMHWLDAARYADTCGFHGDNPFPAWPYRDYVLRSIRDNKPFDQFTREQLAGDLLPDASRTTRVASAFNRMARTSAEGGLQPKEYLAKYGSDRVRTVAGIWLGATVGCAECHDHKFDPIRQKDFYALKAFFADVKETGLVPDQGPKAWGELLPLPDEQQDQKWTALASEIESVEKELEAKRQAIDRDAWISKLKAASKDWKVQVPVAAKSKNGAVLKIYGNEPVLSVYETGGSVVSDSKPGNGLIVASGPNPDNETYTVTLKPGAGTWYSIGLEVNSDDRLPGARLARGSDRLVVTEVTVAGAKIARARSNVSFWDQGLTPWNVIDGDASTGWGVATYRSQRANFLALDFEKPLVTAAGSTVVVTISHDSTWRRAVSGRIRLALAPAENAQPASERSRDLTIPALPKEIDQAIIDSTHPELSALWTRLSRLESDRENLRVQIPRVVTTVADENPAETRVLGRGNFMDESGEVVEPAVPGFLGKLETGGKRATRLDLANWIVSRDNPLTARVYVNRVWRRFFGNGLSKVLEDLGSQGELPTHPELLDWLASEFMTDWDMKRLVRVIVTSETYKQSSMTTPEMLEKDPENRLLARQSRFRVDAELVRDIALSVSGLLAVDKFGGPSVRPYQPEGYLAALNFPKRDYSESHGPDLYRRGIYTFWQRTFLHPSLAAFDGPSREECTLNRSASNTPIQSLVLLNDPSYVEAARAFGDRLMTAGSDIGKRIDLAFARAVSRPVTDKERAVLVDLYRKELARYRKSPADAKALVSTGEAPRPANIRDVADHAATVSVARAILNLHEVITRN
jgi:hypothetical protein